MLHWPGLVSLLSPDLALENTILKLTPDILDQYQLRGLILDVDDTLVSTQATDVSPELAQWLSEIKKVAMVALVSNNLSRSRIQRIATTLELPYAFRAGKPSRRKLRQVVDTMELPLEQVAMVGDRLFTDILAGNRLGLFTILVDPVARASPLSSLEFWIYNRLKASLRRSS